MSPVAPPLALQVPPHEGVARDTPTSAAVDALIHHWCDPLLYNGIGEGMEPLSNRFARFVHGWVVVGLGADGSHITKHVFAVQDELKRRHAIHAVMILVEFFWDRGQDARHLTGRDELLHV